MTKFASVAFFALVFSTSAFAQNIDLRYQSSNTAVGVGVHQTGQRYGAAPGRNFSAADEAALEALATKALGPLPGDAKGYEARMTKTFGAPAPGCELVNEVEVKKGAFARWRCPRGTVSGRHNGV